MPVIDNPALLITDCQVLGNDTSVHEIPKELWPDSVKKLNPVLVSREELGIYITTFAQTGVGSHGYVISMFKPGDGNHFTITDTAYPKIFRFDFKP